MTLSERRGIRVAAAVTVLLVASVVFVNGIVVDTVLDDPEPQPERTASNVKLVPVGDESDVLVWPYTSRRPEFSTLTLPMTVVVSGAAEDVSPFLTSGPVESPQGGFSEGGPRRSGDVVSILTGSDPAKQRYWKPTTGATRYTYFTHEGRGRWVTETAQLQVGTYFGSRTHIRIYETPYAGEKWTVIQSHSEYWDWFRLRHTVGGLADSQFRVEQDLRVAGVRDVDRERFANGGIRDFDGWVTVVELQESPESPAGLSALLFVSTGVLVAGRERRRGRVDVPDARTVAVPLALVSLPVLVRVTGVAIETVAPTLSPKVVAGGLYPLLAVGVPAAAFWSKPRENPETSFTIASLALGAGYFVDLAYLGVAVLPVTVVLHRLVTLVAVGLVAAGGDTGEAWPVGRIGGALWGGSMVWSLLVGP
jgi:hypothetical protein